ncbi:YqjF family protein [Brachybacterium sp. GCM10030268]|uniref:YqjF family protein n=1 Tax=Brachybacterium sp. GCM10030268 TaxID=3273382 RepID=UPI0036148D85
MAGQQPDHQVRLPVGRMGWKHTVFLHYRCDAEQIARLLPPGLTPHLFADQAWLSVTPLVMHRVRPAGLPAPPRWSTFPEVNVRTYVRSPDGRDGLWFFTLQCPCRAMPVGLNPLGLPYRYRPAQFERGVDGRLSYCFHGKREHTLDVSPGEPVPQPSDLDAFLVGRWNAFSALPRVLLRFPVSHRPWPLQDATGAGTMLEMPRDMGLPVLDTAPIVQYSPGVDVALAAPRPVRR